MGELAFTGTPPVDLDRVLSWRGNYFVTPPDRPPASLHKSIILVVGGCTDRAYLQRMKNAAKPHFVREGLMLGTFNPQESGVAFDEEQEWPPRSPVGVLAIREMIRSDDRFLGDDSELLELHHERFGPG